MKGYKKYYGKKLIWYFLTLVFAVILNFVLPRLMPGNPVSAIASKAVSGMTDSTAIQKVLNDYAQKFGINEPMYKQFFMWLGNALRGDFGVSFSQYPRPVSDILANAVWWTICLQMPAIIVGWILGNILGAIAAYIKGVFDKVILPDTIKTIDDKCFCSFYQLNSIDIPYSVTEIGARAFEDCRTLSSVVIPDSPPQSPRQIRSRNLRNARRFPVLCCSPRRTRPRFRIR